MEACKIDEAKKKLENDYYSQFSYKPKINEISKLKSSNNSNKTYTTNDTQNKVLQYFFKYDRHFFNIL